MKLHHLDPCPKCDGKMLMSVKIKKGTLMKEGFIGEDPEGTLYFMCNRAPSHRYLQIPGCDLIEAKGLRIQEWEKAESKKKSTSKGKKITRKKTPGNEGKPAEKRKTSEKAEMPTKKPVANKQVVKTKTSAKAKKSPGKVKTFTGKPLLEKSSAREIKKTAKKTSLPADKKKTATKAVSKTPKKAQPAKKITSRKK